MIGKMSDNQAPSKGGIQLGLYKSLDYWSILENLGKIENYYYDSLYGDESSYKEYYSDQIIELANVASELYQELEGLIAQTLPFDILYNKNIYLDDEKEKRFSIVWFDTVTCMLYDIDMEAMLNNECIYDYEDLEEEREKRIRKLDRLTKKQQMLLFTNVMGFITRFLELQAAFDTIVAIINELNFHQSFIVNKDGAADAPGAAYL